MVTEQERAATERQLEVARERAEQARTAAAQQRQLVKFKPITGPGGKIIAFKGERKDVLLDPVTGEPVSVARELQTEKELATGVVERPGAPVTPTVDTRQTVGAQVTQREMQQRAVQQARQQFATIRETTAALPKQIDREVIPTPTSRETAVFKPPEPTPTRPKDVISAEPRITPVEREPVGGEVLVEAQQRFFKDIGLTGVVEQLQQAGRSLSEIAGFEERIKMGQKVVDPLTGITQLKGVDPIAAIGSGLTQIPAGIASIPIFATTPLQVSVPALIKEFRRRPAETGVAFIFTPIALGKARGISGKIPRPKIVTEPVKLPPKITKGLEGAEAVAFKPVTEGKFAGKVKVFRGTVAEPQLRFVGIIKEVPKPIKKLVFEKPMRKFKVTRLKGVEEEVRLGATPKQAFARVLRRPAFEKEVIRAREVPTQDPFKLVRGRGAPLTIGKVFVREGEPAAAVLSRTDVKVPVKLPPRPKIRKAKPDIEEVARRKAEAEKEGRLLEPRGFEDLVADIERLSTAAGRARAKEFARGRRAPTKKRTPQELLQAEKPQRIRPLQEEKPIIEVEEIPAVTPKTFSIITGASTIAQGIEQRSRQLTKQAPKPLQEQRPKIKITERQATRPMTIPITIQRVFQTERQKQKQITEQVTEQVTETPPKPPGIRVPGRPIRLPILFPKPEPKKRKPIKIKPKKGIFGAVRGKVKAPRAELAPKALGLPDVVASFARRQEKVTPIGAVGAFRRTRRILLGA